MPKRRPMGSLEAEVLGYLWRHDGTALTPGQVLEGLVAVLRCASAGSYSLRSAIGASAARRRTAKPDAADADTVPRLRRALRYHALYVERAARAG